MRLVPLCHSVPAVPLLNLCGDFLPVHWFYTRDLADNPRLREIPLDRPMIAGTLRVVVAASPQWAETHSLIRYPSPYGRPSAPWRRPPLFMSADSLWGRAFRAAGQRGGRRSVNHLLTDEEKSFFCCKLGTGKPCFLMRLERRNLLVPAGVGRGVRPVFGHGNQHVPRHDLTRRQGISIQPKRAWLRNQN